MGPEGKLCPAHQNGGGGFPVGERSFLEWGTSSIPGMAAEHLLAFLLHWAGSTGLLGEGVQPSLEEDQGFSCGLTRSTAGQLLPSSGG